MVSETFGKMERLLRIAEAAAEVGVDDAAELAREARRAGIV